MAKDLEAEARQRAARIKPDRSSSPAARRLGCALFLIGLLYGGAWGWTHYGWPRMFPAVQVGEPRTAVMMHMGPPLASRRLHGPWRGYHDTSIAPPPPAPGTLSEDVWTTIPPGATKSYYVEYDELDTVTTKAATAGAD